jgi:glycine/D-amino acid oxidase-like deaminating enzyme
MTAPERFDAVVIGGGFYGCYLALRLRERLANVIVLEAQSDVLTQASFVNQARVHHGYHYPRSVLTALRSAWNYGPFVEEFADCIDSRFQMLYAVARQGSKTSASQFERFCHSIDVPVEPAPQELRRLFDRGLVEEVFAVDECAFDGAKLRAIVKTRLAAAGVHVRFQAPVARVAADAGQVRVEMVHGGTVVTENAYSCVYSATNRLLQASGLEPLPLKHELAEVALVRLPGELARLGITIVDGPFLSTMPFPATGAHSLSHVRYTPHFGWQDQYPPTDIDRVSPSTNYPFMIRDAQRYVPLIGSAKFGESMYTVKTVLRRNELDDGRPILYRRDYGIKGFSVILGAKIDNVYDVMQAVFGETGKGSAAAAAKVVGIGR